VGVDVERRTASTEATVAHRLELAVVAAHRYAEAATEFQEILDHRGIVAADPIGVLAHLQLGRTLAALGDRAKAKAAYWGFLTLWKNADFDVPILKQGMAEYARLP
jgi:eukaryotic-like serine/threonine-protein kinase